MVGYNLTGIVTNTTDITTFVQGVNNNLMNGMLGTLFLIAIFVVLLSSFFFTTRNWQKSLGATGFLTFLVSLLLSLMGILPPKALLITLSIAAGCVAFMFKD